MCSSLGDAFTLAEPVPAQSLLWPAEQTVHHVVLAFQSCLSLLQSVFLISSGALYYFVPLSQIGQCCINFSSHQFFLHDKTARASAEFQCVWMPALAYFDLGFPHEL